MSQSAQQVIMVQIAYVPLIIISLLAFLGVMGFLWRKGKSVEALLVWLSMWLYIIALILIFR